MDVKGAHMVDTDTHAFTTEKIQKMGSTILECFTKLISENDIVRLDGGLTLLRHLFNQRSLQDQNDNKEMQYALTRLIRSLGSAKTSSRKGFYTSLTIFLTMHPETAIEEILAIMNAELHAANSNHKSENADIYMGRILTCGAMIRSNFLIRNTSEVQEEVIKILIDSGKQRSYLSLVSIMFFIEFLNQLSTKHVNIFTWSLIEKEFMRPWPEQTLDTFYVVLFLHDKFPMVMNKKFLKQHLGQEKIIAKDNLQSIVKLLTNLPRITSCRHPVFKLFCEKLVSTNLVSDFWMKIDQRFVRPSLTDEHLAVEILTLILSNITDKSVLPSLLTANFFQYILKKLSSCKKNNNDESVIAFKELLNLLVTVTTEDDVKTKTQFHVLQNLVIYPGDLMIEKKTGTKIVQTITGHLNFDGVKKLAKLYTGIIENTIAEEMQNSKVNSWTNAERVYAAQLLTRLMGHPTTLTNLEWRIEQLIFLFKCGLCEISNIGTELAPQLKECFYRALDYKLPKLNDLRTVLSTLVHYLHTELCARNVKLRTPLSDAALETWKNLIGLINKLEQKSKTAEAVPIFHTMNLHMGLQLFMDSDMAITSINELQSCYVRLVKKSKKQKKVNNKNSNEEPEWVEVVVDLLLSLLSRNSHLLRSLVGCVFPHICPYLTAAAVHQILAVLDVQNDINPLTTNDYSDDSQSSDDELDIDNTFHNNDEMENDTNEDESDSVEDESDSNEEPLEDDETVTDKLRLAVRQALGDASVQTDDEDIDVDRITDEEGKRLNQSLAAAFRVLRENRQGNRSKKQEKSAQTLTHFRVRVTDLLEVYLASGPAMSVAVDMLVPLFALLEYCLKDPHQKPLENRIRICLKKLSTVKKFKNTKGIDEGTLASTLKALIDKGERSASVCQGMSDKLVECCTFLVKCLQQIGDSSQVLVDIYHENLIAFFEKRDCILPAILFKSILKLYWKGNWQLAPLLVDFAFDNTIRSFRRGQAIEFLTIFYKDSRLIPGDEEHIDVRVEMESKLNQYCIQMFKESCDISKHQNGLSTSHNATTERKVTDKFVYLLLTLLNAIYPYHLSQAWNWTDLASILTTYRTRTSFSKDTKRAYGRLLTQIVPSVEISLEQSKAEKMSEANGKIVQKITNDNTVQSECPDNGYNNHIITQKEVRKKKKDKVKKKEQQMLKREARELREKAMSEGLESLDFSSLVLPNGTDEFLLNGDNNDTHVHLSQKRLLSETADTANKAKRKKYLTSV